MNRVYTTAETFRACFGRDVANGVKCDRIPRFGEIRVKQGSGETSATSCAAERFILTELASCFQ